MMPETHTFYNTHHNSIQMKFNILRTSILLLAVSAMQAEPAVASHPASPAAVVNPQVPRKARFAGKDVDLDRIDMFERLDRELTAMSYTHGNTLLTLKRANRYFPVLTEILKANGVPEDLVYLACIESSLNPTAVSPAKAAGLWQFMPATGREYGLEINDYVDERLNIEKSTAAACRYLKSAYNKYGNWESAAASYNGGMGRISNELSSQGVGSAYDLYLTEETSRYMFRLLAMKMILENPDRYGYRLTAEQLYQPMDYEIIEVSEPVDSWVDWAKQHDLSYYQLRQANPWIKAKSLPNSSGKTYSVKVPVKDSLYRSSVKHKVFNPNWITK